MKQFGLVLLMAALVLGVSCKSDKKCCEDKTQCDKELAAPIKTKKVVVARATIIAGQEAAFAEAAKKLVEATHNEEGNLYYAVYQSPTNAKEFIFYEEYKDDAAFKVHAESEHFKTFVEEINGLVDGEMSVDEF